MPTLDIGMDALAVDRGLRIRAAWSSTEAAGFAARGTDVLRALEVAMAETMTKSALKPSQEIDRLVQVLDGRWDMAVTYQPSEMAPQGGTFAGHEISRRGPGGFSVLVESTSQGPAGPFEGVGTIHWSAEERAYKLHWFTNLSPVPAVFTGRWDGGALIFNGTETMAGQTLASRHSITDIKPDSFHYVIDMGPTTAQLKTMITIDYTKAKR